MNNQIINVSLNQNLMIGSKRTTSLKYWQEET